MSFDIDTIVVVGCGVYLRRRTKRWGTPAAFAKRLADRGIRFVAFGASWHDSSRRGVMTPTETLKRYAEACVAAGLGVGLWGYPHKAHEDLFVEQLLELMHALDDVDGPDFVQVDPERHYRWPRSKRAEADDRAEAFAKAIRHVMSPETFLGMTSYGSAAAAAACGAYGWARVCDWGSPQLYTRTEKQMLGHLDDWAKFGFTHLLPSFGLYRWHAKDQGHRVDEDNRVAKARTPLELHEHLAGLVTSPVPFDAAIGWAENFLTKSQGPVLRRWSSWLERGVCEADPL